MANNMDISKSYVWAGLVCVALLIAALVIFIVPQSSQPVACTTEAKICPDGTAVGRTGPNCEFAACPDVASSSAAGGTVGTSSEGIAPYQSGLKGTVVLGPTCPVETNPPNPACADKPYSTLVTIFPASDPVHAVVITHSDESGAFAVQLPPGDYTIGAGESDLPRCGHPAITVPPTGYVSVTVSCDTGIR